MRKIHIKNMVCSRCTEAVESIFKGQGIGIKNIQLGEVIVDEITDLQILSIESELNQKGFEILKEKNSVLIQKVKNITKHSKTREPLAFQVLRVRCKLRFTWASF